MINELITVGITVAVSALGCLAMWLKSKLSKKQQEFIDSITKEFENGAIEKYCVDTLKYLYDTKVKYIYKTLEWTDEAKHNALIEAVNKVYEILPTSIKNKLKKVTDNIPSYLTNIVDITYNKFKQEIIGGDK